MKINKSILIVGAAVIGLASCEPEMTQPTEEQIDAKVQELVSQRRSELQAQCDADLLAAANMEADKIIMASANQPAAAAPAPAPAPRAAAAPRRATPKAKPRVTTPAKQPVIEKKQEPATVGNGKPKMGGSKDNKTIGSGKPKMGSGNSGSEGTVGSGKPKMGEKK